MVTIVGIAPTVRQRNFQEALPDPVVYVPMRIAGAGVRDADVRTTGDPAALTPSVREEVRAIDPDLPLFGIRTMDQQLAQLRWQFTVFGTMFGIFAVIALLVSAVGLVRGHGLLGLAADAGNRRADGARRAGVAGAVADSAQRALCSWRSG